ncbi:GUN4 domain-containing protein [Dolichospermum circinale]|uniref:GUN4 domain-containing protein n=1 Tax=Dolichospermum circinale TaxID=109265 RepID=UPI00041AB3A3
MEWQWQKYVSLSQELTTVLETMLQVIPAKRYQSATEVLAVLTSKQAKEQAAEVQLKSAAGMDYRKLQDLLAAGKWKEADEETARVMLAVGKWGKKGHLSTEDIDNFPCEDLRTIDQLWVKYSNGRFGFSVQKRIYQSLGGTRTYDEKIWDAFADKVGWIKGGYWLDDSDMTDITFDIKAPEGHLPKSLKVNIGGWKKSGLVGLSIAGGVFGMIATNEVLKRSRFGLFFSLAWRLVNCNI